MKTKTETITDDSVTALPKNLQQYVGCQRGNPAPGERISIHTPMNEAQRDLHYRDIHRWIEQHQGVDWNLFGYTTAVQYPNGTLEVINGQHRMELAKLCLPTCDTVPAHIIPVTEPDYAARLFAAFNGVSSRKLTTEELFWAQVIGKDPYALYVQKHLRRMNLSCGRVNEGHNRKSVRYANFVKCLKMSEEATGRAVSLIDCAYPQQGMDDQVLSGVTRLISLKEYRDYGDTTTQMGREFEAWFTEVVADVYQITDLRFNEYKNTAQWYNGVAYGLAQKFKHYQTRHNRKSVSLKVIKSIYEAGFTKSRDSQHTGDTDSE